MKIENLPTAVQAHLAGFKSDGENLRTASCADVFRYTHPCKQSLFLKVRDTHAAPQESDLLAEKTAMSWLQGKLNVPRVVCFHEKGDTQYLLMTQIAGVSGIHQDAKSDVPNLVRLFARGLREIHAIAVDSCPLDWRMERYFAWATDLIDSGVLDGQIPDGKTRNVLRDELDSIRADLPPEDLVFTHGDYCLPNVMIHNGRLSGYIDLGYAGVGDRYLDFVAAYYTIRRNLGNEWIPLFFQEYGHKLDQARLSVYQRIHDFTY
ncbi:MAG: aminoglycoside 3'-phosphotransferase [Candidatus Poribacteria bacterium]|nr:aminoglycoside 3'-phosphotransferase [Candidatus Poribacteria bacterium]